MNRQFTVTAPFQLAPDAGSQGARRRATSIVSGTTTRYQYRADDERILLSTPTGGTVYPFKFYNVASSTNASTTITKQIFANGELIATIVGSNASATPYYVHTDNLTGANVISNASSSIANLFEYLPFGGARISKTTATFGEQRRFAGHEDDVPTSLNYMDARYPDSSVGRFLSEDPVLISLPSGQSPSPPCAGDLQRVVPMRTTSNQVRRIVNAGAR